MFEETHKVIDGKIFKIYVVDEDLIERLSTLEPSDLGRKYIVVQGCIHFVS